MTPSSPGTFLGARDGAARKVERLLMGSIPTGTHWSALKVKRSSPIGDGSLAG